MQIFAAVKAAVTTREAAVFYGLRVPDNGMICCPFHPDRHPVSYTHLDVYKRQPLS